MSKSTTPRQRRDNAAATSEAAKSIIESEAGAREAKTAKLRAARLKRDAEIADEAAAKPAAAKAKPPARGGAPRAKGKP